MTVTADVQSIYYSKVKSVANPISRLTSPTGCGGGAGDTTQCLGGSDGAGFGWEDMTIFKLGFQWQQSSDLTLRVGYSHGDQPIPKEETMFNIIAPAVITTHYTFGLTQKLGSDSEFNFTGMYAPENSVKGANPLEAPGQQEIEIKMSQWELEGSYSMKF
jgi:long-chain fatty acid transport protein